MDDSGNWDKARCPRPHVPAIISIEKRNSVRFKLRLNGFDQGGTRGFQDRKHDVYRAERVENEEANDTGVFCFSFCLFGSLKSGDLLRLATSLRICRDL